MHAFTIPNKKKRFFSFIVSLTDAVSTVGNCHPILKLFGNFTFLGQSVCRNRRNKFSNNVYICLFSRAVEYITVVVAVLDYSIFIRMAL